VGHLLSLIIYNTGKINFGDICTAMPGRGKYADLVPCVFDIGDEAVSGLPAPFVIGLYRYCCMSIAFPYVYLSAGPTIQA